VLNPSNFDGERHADAAQTIFHEGPENFSRLEKAVNDWLAAKGDSIQPVNSQTATCAIANGGGDKGSQAVVIALWYLDPPEQEPGRH
jgi:hypothetical protein